MYILDTVVHNSIVMTISVTSNNYNYCHLVICTRACMHVYVHMCMYMSVYIVHGGYVYVCMCGYMFLYECG